MSITIQGTFVQNLPTVEGDSSRGHWIRGGFVIEYGEEYPRKVAFSCFGENKVQQAASIPVGQPLQVSFNPESREYNGRYYTELNVTNILLLSFQQPAQPQFQPQQTYQPAAQSSAAPASQPQQQPPAQLPEDPENDLPF